jgi:hypothetical protein
MGEICASGSVGGEGGNVLAYPATWPAMPREKAQAAPTGEFLASDRWQVERKRRIVSHSGYGAGLIRAQSQKFTCW